MTPMMRCIAEGVLQPQRPAQVQLRIALPGEAEATMELDSTVAGKGKRLTRLGLGHAQRDFRILARIDQRGRVIDVGARPFEADEDIDTWDV